MSAATATLSLTVTPAPSFSLSLTPAALNTTQGRAANTTVDINPTGGYP